MSTVMRITITLGRLPTTFSSPVLFRCIPSALIVGDLCTDMQAVNILAKCSF